MALIIIGKNRRIGSMRIRKENNELLEDEIVLKYIMTQNRAMQQVCTKDLVEEFGYAQATISQHMKKLTSSGLVVSKKKEKFSYYFVNIGLLMQYVAAAKKFTVD